MTERKDQSSEEAKDGPLAGMSPREVHDWEWSAHPRWVKVTSLLIGGPAFAILAWSVLDQNAVDARTQAICFASFAAVAILQVYSLGSTIRASKRGEKRAGLH